MTKKLYIKTYGCQMNVYDSTRMADIMAPLGYSTVDSADGADMVILNTCHIREKAEEKVFSDLGRVRAEKTKNPNMIIAVGGCVGQAEGDAILLRAPYVDIVMGPQTYQRLPDLIARAAQKKGVVDLEFPVIPKFDDLPVDTQVQGSTAFLAVQEGCDKFCTFCVVPYTRGAEYSRSVVEIEHEARQLVEKGAVEITLLGQNVNAFHGMDGVGEVTLAALIRRLAKIDGLKRIRYTTSHPRDMNDDLIAVHGDEEKLMPYLHLPVQSGADAVLKRMNRKHNAAFYLDIIDRLRRVRPDIALSSDFIVGFPGETDADFEDTMRLVETVGFAQAYSFKYSPRPGTPAADDAAQVPEPVKEERLHRLQALLWRQQTAFNEANVGKTVDVLFEKPGKLPGQWLGKSPYLQSVHVVADGVQGRVVPVKITGATQSSLAGEVVA